ncbi:MAG TPA: DUF4263 domain-containing protein [Candidatus Woesebacteria bacterium]|nr:DUF4263 domain-containing protein [Candidatus Woesebacteria bacterium]
MSRSIQINSTSNITAEPEDIVLRENSTHRLLFRPLIVDNQNNAEASIKGWFVYQRKNNDGSWSDFTDKNLQGNKLKSGEGIKLELKSEEVLILLNRIETLKQIYGQYGIQYGTKEYLIADENLAATLKSISSIKNDKIIEAFKSLSNQQISVFFQNLNLTNLEKVIQEWDSNIQLKSTEEKYWQTLLGSNSWVLSQIFACPHVLIGNEYYYGGKKGNNKGGVHGDHFLQNKLTGNVAFIEIKTPKTQIVGKKYRGDNDEDNNTVYSITEDLNGGLIQLQNQRNIYLQKKDSLTEPYKSFNSKVVLIIGSISSLSDGQKKSFELYRNSITNAEIITFDELRERLQMLIEIYKASDVEDQPEINPKDLP